MKVYDKPSQRTSSLRKKCSERKADGKSQKFCPLKNDRRTRDIHFSVVLVQRGDRPRKCNHIRHMTSVSTVFYVHIQF